MSVVTPVVQGHAHPLVTDHAPVPVQQASAHVRISTSSSGGQAQQRQQAFLGALGATGQPDATGCVTGHPEIAPRLGVHRTAGDRLLATGADLMMAS